MSEHNADTVARHCPNRPGRGHEWYVQQLVGRRVMFCRDCGYGWEKAEEAPPPHEHVYRCQDCGEIGRGPEHSDGPGHAFKPGTSVDGGPPSGLWCDICGESRAKAHPALIDGSGCAP